MSENRYWVPFTDKENNSYQLGEPMEFLSEKAIDRREKSNIPITIQDLPVSDFYADSLESLGLKLIGRSKWFNAVLVESEDKILLDSLNQLGFVKDFSTDIQNFSKPLTESCSGAEFLFNGRITYGETYTQLDLLGGISLQHLGYKGKGIDIAVLDAGFYKVDSLPVFRNLWENNQIKAVKNFVDSELSVFGENISSHGMSVLSTMSVFSPSKYIGTAPEASYLLLRSEYAPSENKSEEAYWVFAAEFADSAGADIITSSLGYHFFDSTAMNYRLSDLDGEKALVTRAAEIAFSKGMIVVSSAGNTGGSTWNKITPPADGLNVLSVGSIDTARNVSAFSSRGNTTDGRIKPDVLAVGFAAQVIRQNGEPGNGYGTSFSAPQIAGLTACLWEAMPDKSNIEIVDAIKKSSNRYFAPDSIRGYGVPNYMKALWLLNALDENKTLNGPEVYPNPFESEFFIIAPFEIKSISIYSYTGSLFYSYKGNWQKNEIIPILNPGIQPSGIYFLVLKNNQKEIVSKIIRK